MVVGYGASGLGACAGDLADVSSRLRVFLYTCVCVCVCVCVFR